MRSLHGVPAKGKIIRFFIIIFLLMTVFSSAFLWGERYAFAGPALMLLLAFVILCLYFVYNRIMNPGPDDPMLVTRRDYFIAAAWCCGIFIYLEVLAGIRFLFLPHVYPSLVVSPGLFQILALFPMALFLSIFFLWWIIDELSLLLDAIRAAIRALRTGYYRNPKSFQALGVVIATNIILILLLWGNSCALSENRIDRTAYYQNSSFILWAIVIVDIIAFVLAFVIVGMRSPDTR
jgi:hypothetical protein